MLHILMPRVSIRWIVPAIVIAPVFAVAVVLTLLAYETAQRIAGDLAGQNMRQIHGRIEAHLNQLMDLPPAINSLNRSRLRSGEMSMDDPARNRQAIFETLRTFPDVSSIVLGSANGQNSSIIRYPGESSYCLEVEQMGENSLFVALGDVMGHGIAAAMLMASARGCLRSRATQCASLGELLTHVNRLLAADTGGTRFMTMFLGVIDMPTMSLRWASAGHDQPLLYDPATGKLMDIEGANGLPLGVMDSETYEERTHTGLRPGQIMLLGTDGLMESKNGAGEQFGKERVREAMTALAHLSATEIEAGVYQRLKEFCGGRANDDDITYVVIKFAG